MLLYYIKLIKMNTQLRGIIALLMIATSMHAVYRNTFTASYVIYPEGGGIKRFRGYVAKWIPSYFITVSNKQLLSIY